MNNINIPLFQKVSLVDRYNFYEYISVMLDGGVTISETLDSVQTKIKNEFFRQKIRQLQTFVSSGDSFSRSMKKLPQVFQSSEISIVEAGEATGKLSASLASLSENMRKTHELRQKIRGALTYPTIIFLFLFLSVMIVLTYVIPAITPLFTTAEVELPAATKALIATSDFIRGYFAILIFL
jgi:type II secretory pathway component PulF